MAERLQELISRIQEWWGKFTTRQKALIISIFAVVLVAIGITVYFATRPEYYTLATAQNAQEAATIKSLLDGDNIAYTQSDDGMTFTINKEDEATASILLGTNNIPSNGYSIADVFDGGFSTTEADKEKKYQLYLESRFEQQLASMDGVASAQVNLSIPADDGTILSLDKESYANVILKLDYEMPQETAAGIANWISTGLGNETSDNILIMDSAGNVLFSGGDSSSSLGIANSQLSTRQKLENIIKGQVKDVVIGTAVYDNCAVGLNLIVDFNEKEVVDHHYYVDEGQTQGYLDSRSEYTEESSSGSGGVPGTDTNDDDTTYVLEDNQQTSTAISDITENYLPSETITTTKDTVGTINYDDSSVTVVVTNYVMYNEDILRDNGTLGDQSFDEYTQGIQIAKTDVDQDLYSAVANATGISQENITILAYDVPFFEYASEGRTASDYLQIILAVIVFLMLGFIVLRTLRKNKVEEEEPEPELSVEKLLETTRSEEEEDELDRIGYTEKSEARLLIEQFVDEQPEAVAAILRNWLNEDWG